MWQPQGQIYLDNRVHQRQAGFHVLTPLQLADGRWLLVNRGWLPKQPGQLPQAAPPIGPVQLLVRLQAAAAALCGAEPAGRCRAGLAEPGLGTPISACCPLAQVAALALQLDGEQDALKRDWPSRPTSGWKSTTQLRWPMVSVCRAGRGICFLSCTGKRRPT